MCVGYLRQCTGKIVYCCVQQQQQKKLASLKLRFSYNIASSPQTKAAALLTIIRGAERKSTCFRGTLSSSWKYMTTLTQSWWWHWMCNRLYVCLQDRVDGWHMNALAAYRLHHVVCLSNVCVVTSSWPAAERVKTWTVSTSLFRAHVWLIVFWHLDAIVEEPWNSKHSFWCFAACISHGASMCMNAHDASPLFSVAAGWLTSTALWWAEDHGEGLSFIFSPPDRIPATSE